MRGLLCAKMSLKHPSGFGKAGEAVALALSV